LFRHCRCRVCPRRQRNAIADVAARNSARFHGIFLVADLGKRLERIGGRVSDASDADASVAHSKTGTRSMTSIGCGSTHRAASRIRCKACAAVGCELPPMRRRNTKRRAVDQATK
jgi:predicted kinase